MLSSILFVVLTVIRVVIAILLTRTGLHKETRSVIWLAGLFYLTIIFSLSGAGVPIPLPLVIVFQGLGQACLVMFLATTFYNHRSSPMSFFMGLTILATIVALVISLTHSILLFSVQATAYAVVVIAQIGNWIWNAVAARQGLKDVSQDKYVEDWVKSRYRLMVIYSLVFLIPCSLAPFVSVVPQGVVLLVFLIAFSVLVVQYLVWGMPEFFRNYLNRHYKPMSLDMNKIMSMSEEEIMGLAQK